MEPKRIVMDYETRSMSNLKKQGSYKYSLDPTTRPTCLAIRVQKTNQEIFFKFEQIDKLWKDHNPKFKEWWLRHIKAGTLFVAQNAFFEICIYKNIQVKRYGWPDIPFRQFRCTAAKAAACALPRSLENAGFALGLTTQKDKDGYNAMMATCKPTRKWNAWKKACADQKTGVRIGAKKLKIIADGEPKMFLDYADNPDTWETLYKYCKIDTRSEDELDLSIPDLIPAEQELWYLNIKTNWNGLYIDLPTIKKITGYLEKETHDKLGELDSITMGIITKAGARNSILEFLSSEGVDLPDLKAKTVEDALSNPFLPPTMKELLEIRRALSKTSTRKYQSFLDRVCGDGRVRDISMFHGSHTGRDTGTGIQFHNFPRPLIKQADIDFVVEVLENSKPGDETTAELFRALYGNLGMVFSSLLRAMVKASPGYKLTVADFAKIEVVVLWWLADNAAGLKILEGGKDPYIYQAAQNLKVTYDEIDPEGSDRGLGKAQILGCGFGLGKNGKKFQMLAWDQYRLKLTIQESRLAVKNYREANAPVVELWAKYEKAAIAAVRGKGKKYRAGKCLFFTENRFLWIQLPSGRRLAYRNPSIIMRMREYEVEIPIKGKDGKVKLDENGEELFKVETRWSGPHATINFWGVHPKTKKWSQMTTWGGTLAENITQAIARDIMFYGSLRADKKGHQLLFQVHDEGVTQRKIDEVDYDDFISILCERPSWGKDIPIQAKGYVADRYRK